jgi:hypothetical protein
MAKKTGSRKLRRRAERFWSILETSSSDDDDVIVDSEDDGSTETIVDRKKKKGDKRKQAEQAKRMAEQAQKVATRMAEKAQKQAQENMQQNMAQARKLSRAREALPWLVAGPSKARRLADRATNFAAPELESDYTELSWDVPPEDTYKQFLHK